MTHSIDEHAPAPAGGFRTAAQIIQDAGGSTHVSRVLDRKLPTVSNWRTNGIAEDQWARFIDEGWASGVEELRAASVLAGVKRMAPPPSADELRQRLAARAGGPTTPSRILDDAGGSARVARALPRPLSTVSSWRNNGIPDELWQRFVDEGWAASHEELRAASAALGVQRHALSPPLPVIGEAQRRQVLGAHGGLLAFTRLIEIPGLGPGRTAQLAAHHRLWLEKLEAVERGEVRRLMGFMPPGSAKSTYAVDVFTPWFLGRGAKRSVLVVTYATALAGRRGRKARSVTRQPVYRALFGAGPEAGRASAVDWGLDNGGEWMGAGMLAGITGNRADLIVVDDPVKGRTEADSPLVRRRTREEFDDTVRTRLKAGGRIVLIQTRWHEDDLAGSLLPVGYDGRSGPVLCRDGEVWEVVCLPAMAERADDPLGRAPGDWLWPEYWGEDHWGQFRQNPRTWNALYQQRPAPIEGSYFERGWFRRFQDHERPGAMRFYGTSDYAVTAGGGDYTRLVVWGVDARMNLWRMASWGGQTSSDVWIERQCDLIEEFRRRGGGIRRWFGEAGVIQRAVEPMLLARLRERRLSCALEWLGSGQDKAARARGAQALAREGRVWVRDDGDGDCFIDECVAFPAGRHDDEVDCFSLIGRAVDRLVPPVADRGLRETEFADMGSVWEQGVNSGFGLPEYAEMGSVWD